MSEDPVKSYPTLGCCGLDCGLCPRYYTAGGSRCPGCCGPDFFDKHPSCPFITCCVKKKKLEVCAECNEFPCSKLEGFDACDSFITHGKALHNLNFISEHGIEEFLKQHKKRIDLLEIMLKQFDEGRSKIFYCIATALLSITALEQSLRDSERRMKADKIRLDDAKARARILREFLNDSAAREGTELKLRKKVTVNDGK